MHWYKPILDAVPLPISVTNINTEWEFINKATEIFLNVNREDVLGEKCHLCDFHICNTENCGIECAKRGRKQTLLNQNGLSFQVETEILRDVHSNPQGYVQIWQDITRIKEMAQKQASAEESDRLKTAFLANMSHEIRTPLNAIVGFSHLLVRKNYDDEKRHMFLNQIKSNSDQLLTIINDILDISKIESQQLILSYQWINLNALLQTIFENMQIQQAIKTLHYFVKNLSPIPKFI